MKIEHEDRDAIELIKDIKREMEIVRGLISTLEYVVYQCDERCEIKFFERGSNDKDRSEKGIKAD